MVSRFTCWIQIFVIDKLQHIFLFGRIISSLLDARCTYNGQRYIALHWELPGLRAPWAEHLNEYSASLVNIKNLKTASEPAKCGHDLFVPTISLSRLHRRLRRLPQPEQPGQRRPRGLRGGLGESLSPILRLARQPIRLLGPRGDRVRREGRSKRKPEVCLRMRKWVSPAANLIKNLR